MTANEEPTGFPSFEDAVEQADRVIRKLTPTLAEVRARGVDPAPIVYALLWLAIRLAADHGFARVVPSIAGRLVEKMR
jgi:hypothetical protein